MLCRKTWPRDPALEVCCPTCAAARGQRCRRPSGHTLPFGDVHAARDLLAAGQGHYGHCPFGRCPDHPDWPARPAEAASLQLELFG